MSKDSSGESVTASEPAQERQDTVMQDAQADVESTAEDPTPLSTGIGLTTTKMESHDQTKPEPLVSTDTSGLINQFETPALQDTTPGALKEEQFSEQRNDDNANNSNTLTAPGHVLPVEPSEMNASTSKTPEVVADIPKDPTHAIPHTIPNPTEQSTEHQAAGSAIGTDTLAVKAQSRPISRATSVTGHANGEANVTGAPTRVYLKEQVNDYLLEGMRWLASSRPENGLLALGNYLCSADSWRNRPGNEQKSTADFHRYWLQYQTWKAKGNQDKPESEFYITL